MTEHRHLDVSAGEGESLSAAVHAAVSVVDLVREYPSGARVGPITFDVPRGAVTGLVGPNGVGKTTTIRMLLGLVTPDGGRIRLLDADGPANLASALGRVGALIEGPAVVPGLTGRRNLQVLARLAGWPDSVVDSALDLVGLTDRADRRVREYSLGMRQRLALAGALLGDPELVILDEPANGLDPQAVVELRSLLARLAGRGTTVVVSSHVLAEVEQVCDHLVVMSDAGVAFHGSRAALVARLHSTQLIEVVEHADAERLSEVLRRRGHRVERGEGRALTVTDPDGGAPDGGSVNAAALEAGILLSRIEPRRQSLEEAFFDLTGAPGSTGERLGLSVDGRTPAEVAR